MYIFFTYLADEDLGEVLDEVIDLASSWTSMCTALRLKPSAEDTIARQYFHNPGDYLKAVLRKWLCKEYNTEKHGLPTWRKLVEAVAKPAGGNNPDLAREIAKKHQIENLPLVTPISSVATGLYPAGPMAYGSPQGNLHNLCSYIPGGIDLETRLSFTGMHLNQCYYMYWYV